MVDASSRLGSMGMACQLPVDSVYTDSGSAGVMLKCSQGGGAEARDLVPEVVVEKTELLHPYPNPFNPVTNIAFSLKNPGSITLAVFDIRGLRVKVLESGPRDMGHHTVSWFGDNSSGQRVASGVYFVRLVADGQNMIKRMLLVK